MPQGQTFYRTFCEIVSDAIDWRRIYWNLCLSAIEKLFRWAHGGFQVRVSLALCVILTGAVTLQSMLGGPSVNLYRQVLPSLQAFLLRCVLSKLRCVVSRVADTAYLPSGWPYCCWLAEIRARAA
eukprot:353365-Chlamydomonas_euryale.AAC.1